MHRIAAPKLISIGSSMRYRPSTPSGLLELAGTLEPGSGGATRACPRRTLNFELRKVFASVAVLSRMRADMSIDAAPKRSKARAPKEKMSIAALATAGISEKPGIYGARTWTRIILKAAASNPFGKPMNRWDKQINRGTHHDCQRCMLLCSILHKTRTDVQILPAQAKAKLRMFIAQFFSRLFLFFINVERLGPDQHLPVCLTAVRSGV